jgi:hypothetical protein
MSIKIGTPEDHKDNDQTWPVEVRATYLIDKFTDGPRVRVTEFFEMFSASNQQGLKVISKTSYFMAVIIGGGPHSNTLISGLVGGNESLICSLDTKPTPPFHGVGGLLST